MKALLFGLLALQLVTANESAYGMRHQQPLPPLRSIPSPSHGCMRDLIDKFGAKETISTSGSPSKTTKVMEIDISYPSFLKFFTRKYIELSKNELDKAKEDFIKRIELMKAGGYPKFYDRWSFSSEFVLSRCIFEVVESGEYAKVMFREAKCEKWASEPNVPSDGTNLDKLIQDILPLILKGWEGHEMNWIDPLYSSSGHHFDFDNLFGVVPAMIPNEIGPKPERSHRGLLPYSYAWRTDIPFVGWVLNEICVAMDDPTVQQRIKSLLILRAITDRELNDAFGVGKLDKIIVVESNEGNYLRPGDGDGQYIIGLDVSKNNDPEYVIVQKDKSNPLEKSLVALSTKPRFFNEAMHRIYHYVIAPWQLSPVMPTSWKFDDSAALLNPWSSPQMRNKAGELLTSWYHEPLNPAKSQQGKLEEGRIKVISQQIVDHYNNYGRNMWANLEDVLTTTGSVPVDIAPNERYRIIDQQNLGTEMGSAIREYKLTQVHMDGPYKASSEQEEIGIREVMLKALLDKDGKLLSKKDLDPKVRRLYMELNLQEEESYLELRPRIEAEEEFLRTFLNNYPDAWKSQKYEG